MIEVKQKGILKLMLFIIIAPLLYKEFPHDIVNVLKTV